MSTARAPRVEPRRQRVEPARPALRIVDTTAAGSRPSPGRVGVVAGTILFAALFALAGFQTVLVNGQARIDDLDKRISTQEARRRDLAVSLATMQSPERITSVARDRLGMIEPAASGYLRPKIDDDARAAYVPPPPTSTPATTAPSSGTTTKPTQTTSPSKATTSTTRPTTSTTKPTTSTTAPSTTTTTRPTTSTTKATTSTTRVASGGAR